VNLKEIKELIKLINENGFTEFEIEREGFRLRVSRSGPVEYVAPITVAPPVAASAPAMAPPPSQPVAASKAEEVQEEVSEELHIIKSPLVGTFYRSPSPTSEAFVKIGDQVEAETVVCIIEAMKLMNNIQAEVAGVVVKVFVENGQPVEYGQPLFGMRI
jgi:acetyl-CoA carboxylase biotin carboxyl carrier protein